MSKSPFAGVTSSAKRIALDQPAIKNTTATLSLLEITDRPGGDTRLLNQSHIEALAESISAVGLIQPIAVDKQGRLLAGGHRRAAIEYLKESNIEVFNKYFSDGIPIHRYEFDATNDAELALAIEATENEKRRDYTATEVRDLADRLRAAGYHHAQGRAKSGQKSLLPSLSVIVGKSERTIQRYLSDKDSSLNTTDVVFGKQLDQAIRSLQKLQGVKPASAKERRILKELPEIITLLKQGC